MRTPIDETNRNEPVSKSNADVGRRDFLKSAVAATVVAGAGSQAWAVETKEGMPYRALGRTGAKISAIGLGGISHRQKRDKRTGEYKDYPQRYRPRDHLHGQLLGL